MGRRGGRQRERVRIMWRREEQIKEWKMEEEEWKRRKVDQTE